MPIYEYVCDCCSSGFEKLVTSEEKIDCPECHSESLTKQFSTFGVGGGEGRKYESLPMYKSGGGCCNPGNCGCKS